MNEFRRRVMVGKGGGEVEGCVDLGLPSGLLWAKGNLVKTGSSYTIGEETDWGTYVSWGNVVGHNEGEGYNFNSSTYNGTPGKNLTANIAVGDTYDAARACLGTPWRMPTKENFQELYDNTDREWTTINGVNGRKFMKKTDHSVFVFFPAAGYYNGTSLNGRGSYGCYWSSSYYDSSYAYGLYFNSSGVNPQNYRYRYYGFSVRGVCNIYYPGRQGVFVYDTRGKFYTADEWSAGIADGSLDNDDVVGVAVISGEHRFVIAPQTLGTSSVGSNAACTGAKNWGNQTSAESDFSGEANTEAMLDAYGRDSSKAAYKAASYEFKNGRQGHLPSMGELTVAYGYKSQVDACASAIGWSMPTSAYLWSSSYTGKSGSYYTFAVKNWPNGATSMVGVTTSRAVISTYSLD